jgi:hypothetical protein
VTAIDTAPTRRRHRRHRGRIPKLALDILELEYPRPLTLHNLCAEIAYRRGGPVNTESVRSALVRLMREGRVVRGDPVEDPLSSSRQGRRKDTGGWFAERWNDGRTMIPSYLLAEAPQ